MADNNDDGGTEWYEEPITIVGFVAGFLLLVLVIASILILCYARDEEQEEQKEEGTEDRIQEESGTKAVYDKVNPLYLSANEYNLQPFPASVRAKFVHIHVDEQTQPKGFQAYYNTND